MFKKYLKQFRVRRHYLASFALAAITLAVSLLLAQSVPAQTSSPGEPGLGTPETHNSQATSVVYLPITIKTWPPIPTVPVIDPIDNADQDNSFVVSWKNPGIGDTYILEESMDPAFPSPNVAYQGPAFSWQTSAGSKFPGVYYFRVKTKNNYGESAWSEVQSIRIYPLFVGLKVRYDGMGYIRGIDYYDIGWHETISLDSLTDSDTIQAQFHDWYDPDPLEFGGDYETDYYRVTTGEWLASNVPADPDWKWGASWKLAYDATFVNDSTIQIGGQKFTVKGPIAGTTSYGKPISFWEFVNQNKILYYDDGGDWKQYINPGQAIVRYDAGGSGLLIYRNITRRFYYQGDDIGETVQYIMNLTAASSLPGSPPVEFGSSLNSPSSTTQGALDIKSIYENGFPRW
jgi:hypothetical protein